MNSATRAVTTPRKAHPLGLLHRYGGVTAAVLVIVLSATGIALNHSDELRFDERRLHSRWLLNLYGIESPEIKSFRLGSRYLSSDGTTIYLNARPIARPGHGIDQVYPHPEGMRVDSNDEAWLFTSGGDLLEVLDASVAGQSASRSAPVASLPAELRAELERNTPGDGITVERLLLDLHSGRLIGRAGVWLADFAAVLFILLALSGLWLWSKTRR
ncbi:MAG: hypothetical protein HKN56_05610 [Gammaproteobacteria bacterium]|nr:hypothetical protein [Gammaproteobacteria bacterium]